MRASLILFAVVAVVFGVLWTQQRRLIYFPFGNVPNPGSIGLTGTSEVSFPTSDGLTLHGWLVEPPVPPRLTVLVFNGNGGNRSLRAGFARALRDQGFGVLLFDYRGFGGSAGAPSEHGLTEDARAAREFLVGRIRIDQRRLVYFGESLGTAVAAELAVEHPPAALILRSPFTSLADVGAHHYAWLPVRWLLRDRYPTIEHIAKVRSPLLVIAGDRDRIVPIAYSRRLFEAANDPKSMVVIAHADHNDQVLFEGTAMIAAIARFLAEVP